MIDALSIERGGDVDGKEEYHEEAEVPGEKGGESGDAVLTSQVAVVKE